MFAEILVAVDASPRALPVFWTAIQVARAFGSRLHLFRAPEVPPEFPAAGAGTKRDLLPDYLLREALADLDELTRRAPDVAFAPSLARAGRPWRLILRVADEVDADLIVVGSHGFGGVDRIIGTTAARVANRATRDVMVVHGSPRPGSNVIQRAASTPDRFDEPPGGAGTPNSKHARCSASTCGWDASGPRSLLDLATSGGSSPVW